MATGVSSGLDIMLSDEDETVVTIKPLVIGRLRKFLAAWNEFQKQILALSETDDVDPMEYQEKSFDTYITCCGIALEKELKGKFAVTFKSNKQLAPEYREFLENSLDMDTIFEIMDVCGGLKLNDPKLQEAVQAATAETLGEN